jgi:hypothetical protein
VDCDNDGIVDPLCQDATYSGFIGSASGCAGTWPNGGCQADAIEAIDLSGTYTQSGQWAAYTVTITQQGNTWQALTSDGWSGTFTIVGVVVDFNNGVTGVVSGSPGSYVLSWNNGNVYTQTQEAFWKLGIGSASCDTTCANEGMICSTASLQAVMTESAVANAAVSAGVSCQTFSETTYSGGPWDGPWLYGGQCGYNSNSDWTPDCARETAQAAFNRICPCTQVVNFLQYQRPQHYGFRNSANATRKDAAFDAPPVAPRKHYTRPCSANCDTHSVQKQNTRPMSLTAPFSARGTYHREKNYASRPHSARALKASLKLRLR